MRRYGRIGFVAAVVASNIVFAVGMPDVAHATSITVNTALDPAPNAQGNFPTDGRCSLRAAIRSAESNSNANDVDCATGLPAPNIDIITLDQSLQGSTFTLTYATAGGVQPFDGIYAGGPIEIVGDTTDPTDFVISGANAVRPFSIGFANIVAGALKLANLTIANGNGEANGASVGFPDGFGGAIALGDNGTIGSTLTLDNVVLRNNSAASRGGAIYGTMPTITNNGGAYKQNSSGDGGAIAVDSGPWTLNGYAVLFEANAASSEGGAIYSNPGFAPMLVHLERSLLLNNTATLAGGGVYVNSSVAGKVFELWDSTAEGNSNVFFSQANTQSFEFLRDTFVNNVDNFRAGVGFTANSIIEGGTCQNTAAAGNITGTRNLVNGGAGCGLAGLADIGDVTNLGPLAQNGGPEVQRTHALLAGSNAIDNGNAAWCGTIDARSVERGLDGNGILNNPQAGDCDIGAYEYAKFVVNFLTGTPVVNENAGTIGIPVKLRILDPTAIPLSSPVVVNVALGAGSTARIGTGPLDDLDIPGNAVTFPVGSVDNAIANLNINIHQDDIAEANGETANIDLTNSPTPGTSIAEPRSVSVVIQDDDQAGVIITETAGNTLISEATPLVSDSFNVKLQSRPDYIPNTSTPADVNMTITPDRDCVLDSTMGSATQAAPLTLTILNANWNVGFDMSARAIDDPYDEDFRDESAVHTCEVRFTFTSLDPVYAATQDALDIDVSDNDTAGVLSVRTGGPLVMAEGSADGVDWNISLTSAPDPGKPLPGVPRAPTSVIVTPGAQCDAGNGPGVAVSRTFDHSNWSVPQQIHVTATQNLVVELLHTCNLPVTISSGDPIYANIDDPPTFAGTPAALSTDIQDYEPPGITDDPPFVDITTGNGIIVDEATPATFDTMTVVLRRAPLGSNVQVVIDSVQDPSIGDAQVLTSIVTALKTTQTTLTFTPANWNVPQTVEVAAFDDDYDESAAGVPHNGSLTVNMNSAAPGFSDPNLRRIVVDGGAQIAGAATISASVFDEDVSGLDITWPASVTEGGSSAQVPVKLTSHPFEVVTITFTVTNGQCRVNGGSTYTTATIDDNWNVGEAITVAAVDDAVLEDPQHACPIDITVNSTDAKYDVLDTNKALTVNDDEIASVLVTTSGGTSVTEGGTGDSVAIVLGAQPASDVVVNLTPANGQTNTLSATFTNGNWDTPQVLAVAALDDAIDETSPFLEQLPMLLTTNAPGYNAAPVLRVDATLAAWLAVEVIDDDVFAFTLTGSTLDLTENGGTDTYSLVLESQPVADVNVTISATGLCTPSTPSHTFTSLNWNTPFVVTVTAGNDDIDGTASCTVDNATSSADPNYNALSSAATGAVVDDDTADVIVSAAAGTVAEQGETSTTYTVVLATEPTASVTISATADGQLTVDSGAPMTFTSSNWNQPQTITVSAVDDLTAEAASHIGTVTHAATSGDANYDGIAVADASISILENETSVTLTLNPTTPNDASATTVTANVTGGTSTPTGTVTFELDSVLVGGPVTLGSGAGQLNLGTLAGGSHTLEVTYSGDAEHAGASLTINFDVERQPVADDETLSIAEDAPATAANVLTGDVDGDGDSLSVTAHTDAAHGTVVCTAADCTYQPNANFNGSDSFTYTVGDGTGLFDTATVTINVSAVDDSPAAPAVATVNVPFGQSVTFELLNGATDVDGDVLVIVSFAQPQHGSVFCNTAGTCTYTPQAGYSGPDQFSYVVGDGQPDISQGLTEGAPVTAVVQLQVQPAPATTTTAAPSTTTAPGTPTTTQPGTGAGTGAGLPPTGSDAGPSTSAALVAIAFGGGLLFLARRGRNG
ncbi:MAG TPA: Ig-like domain-containing protein [Ilumatobacter sp.]